MIKRSSRQTGSVQIVIIVVLVIALLGELGFFVWRTVTDNATESARKEAAKVVKYKTYKDDDRGISFEYPSNWWVDASPIDTTSEYSYDVITIKTDKGRGVILESGVERFNGACGTDEYNPYIPYNVMEAVPTILPSREASTSLSFTLLPKEEGDETYEAQYGLTSEYTKLGDQMACRDSFQYVFSPIIETINTNINRYQLMSFGGFEEFKTKEDAKKFIASDEYKAIKKMILSLKY